MSGQAIDLRATLATLRRRRRTLAVAGVVGAVIGVALVLVEPPQYTSASQVLLPPAPSVNGQPASRDSATDAQVARSEVVLGRAARAVKPVLTMSELADRVTVTSPAGNVLQFRASASERGDARALADAAAQAEVRYIQSAANSVANAQQAALVKRQQALRSTLGNVSAEIKNTTTRLDIEDPTSAEGKADATALAQLTAQQADLTLQIDHLEQTKSSATDGQPSTATLIQQATTPRRPGLVPRYLLFGVGGLALALLLTAVTLAVFGRRDRRLRFRDEIADALGSPVTAAIRAHVPRSVAGWTSLLQTYEPETVDAWALRQSLRQLVNEADSVSRRQGRSTGRFMSRAVITVVSLADDEAGLTMGPQLAAYAASTGVRTRLVAAQRHESAAALWAACHRGPGQEEVRPGLFVDSDLDGPHEYDLTVVLAVVDPSRPSLGGLPAAAMATTVIAVASGAATAEELARTAVTADDAGADLHGILLANPDELDRTTGRLLQHERAQEVALPSRLSGIPSARSPRAKSASSSAASQLRRRRP